MPPLQKASEIEIEVNLLNPLQLAYIGDTVWDLLVRTKLLKSGANVNKLHSDAVKRVNAKAQADALNSIIEMLTEKEKEYVIRGRNAKSKHRAPKNQSQADYCFATGFEALVGYLYLSNQNERLEEIFNTITAKENQ